MYFFGKQMYENPPIISHFRYGNVSDEIFLTFFGKIFAGKEKVCIFAVLFGNNTPKQDTKS